MFEKSTVGTIVQILNERIDKQQQEIDFISRLLNELANKSGYVIEEEHTIPVHWKKKRK